MNEVELTVYARIDANTKRRAIQVLEDSGLNLSDAVRLFLTRVAADQCLPFDIKIPNQTTRDAMAETEADNGPSFDTIDDLMNDLNAED